MWVSILFKLLVYFELFSIVLKFEFMRYKAL